MKIYLETNRLFLREMDLEDEQRVFDLDSDPEVMKFLTRGVPSSREAIRSALERTQDLYRKHEGDVLMVALSLYALSRDHSWRNRAALMKGILMIALGCGSLMEAATGFYRAGVPQAQTMGYTGLLVFACNLICLALLWPRKGDDLNMKSTWLCTVTDLLTDLGLLIASVLVWTTGSSGASDFSTGNICRFEWIFSASLCQ